MNIAITGHRPNKLGNDYDLKSDLISVIKARIMHVIHEQLAENYHIDSAKHTLITGMALGIDTLFALIAIEMRLSFIAAIPCQQQYKMWPQKSKERWLDITDHELCTKHYVSQGDYSPEKMQLRNQWMVDHCDFLIAVWDGTPGGTANCVKYAQSVNKHIVFINPKEL